MLLESLIRFRDGLCAAGLSLCWLGIRGGWVRVIRPGDPAPAGGPPSWVRAEVFLRLSRVSCARPYGGAVGRVRRRVVPPGVAARSRWPTHPARPLAGAVVEDCVSPEELAELQARPVHDPWRSLPFVWQEDAMVTARCLHRDARLGWMQDRDRGSSFGEVGHVFPAAGEPVWWGQAASDRRASYSLQSRVNLRDDLEKSGYQPSDLRFCSPALTRTTNPAISDPAFPASSVHSRHMP